MGETNTTEESALIEAPVELLPPLLVDPPWTRGGEPVVLKGFKRPKDPVVLEWRPGEREAWLERPYAKGYVRRPAEDTDWPALAASWRDGVDGLRDDDWHRLIGLLLTGPEELGRDLLDRDVLLDAKGKPRDVSELRLSLDGIVARHGLAAYRLALAVARFRASRAEDLMPFLSADVAALMVNVFDEHRDGAPQEWFARHGLPTVRLIVPDALRKPGPKRAKAEAALRLLARLHGHDAVVEAARHHGDAAAEAIAALKTDPLDQYPDPLPELGAGIVPEKLPRLFLEGGELALPHSATRHFLSMLSFCTPEVVYPGVDAVADLLDPAALAEFAWALYRADDSPKWASPWVAHALQRFGDDGTARRLAPTVLGWTKADAWDLGGVAALDVFTAIGTDEALRLLHQIVLKAEDVKRIRPWARGKLNRAAQARGMTGEQLADRLVPDLGLDADGTLTLDYGPRRFTVGFDERLVPFAVGADGARHDAPPEPGAGDDPALASAARARFAELRRAAGSLASDQIGRLEEAMLTGRRWTSREFATLLLAHPLVGHITRRLVWLAEEEDGTTAAFRVAEDRTLADVHDGVYTLSKTAQVALPHPLHLDGALPAWSQVLADYEIVQPFPQLGREVHVLTEEERGAAELARFEGATAHYGRLLGLTRKGWEIGHKESGGFQRALWADVTPEFRVTVSIDPGIRVLAPDDAPIQRIESVRLTKKGTTTIFGEMDRVTASEVVATLRETTGMNV
ncbi:DUF4132 domain-containing protein [Spirillospora sp. CA-294931]|uniref:DUF4132 domain-containing protein n=1 Tax=Spirillospora sp. CA-294931 TaxID=3240042 RepID=UPI003D908F54